MLTQICSRNFLRIQAGFYEPTLSQVAAPAGTPIEKRVSLSHVLLVAAVILFLLEMILRRFSIASGYLAELRAQLHRQSDADAPETLTRLAQKKDNVVTISNSDIQAQMQTVSKRENIIDEDVPELAQPTEGTMTRLLAAKRRSRSV